MKILKKITKDTIDYSSKKDLKKCMKRKGPENSYFLGLFYLNGLCLPRNVNIAYDYFEESFNAGYLESEVYIAFIEYQWLLHGQKNDFLSQKKYEYSWQSLYTHALSGLNNGFSDAAILLLKALFKLNLTESEKDIFNKAIHVASDNHDGWACGLAIQQAINGNKEFLIKDTLEETINYFYELGGENSDITNLLLSKYWDMKKDFNKSLVFLKKSAELNQPEALYMYARYLYAKGELFEAESYMRKSAKQNYPVALAFMGDFYRQPERFNLIEAVTWYNRAIEQNYTNAMVALGALIFSQPTETIMSYEDAKNLILKAGKMNNPTALAIIKREKWL